ncbi:MAG: hypothetical protein M3P11_10255 [Actinomycetota bacterium]|nr:hypothetical protein [Actinomycetota bacterium]
MMKRLLAIAVGTALLSSCASSGTTPADAKAIDCRASDDELIAFQAVPSAIYMPCINAIPLGWSFGGSHINNGLVQFWLNSDRAGFRAAEVTLTQSCDTAGAVAGSGTAAQPGIAHYEKPISLSPRFSLLRFDVFTGGCVTYRFDFQEGASSLLVFELDDALSFLPRSLAVRKVRDDLGLTLCGAGAPPCPG